MAETVTGSVLDLCVGAVLVVGVAGDGAISDDLRVKVKQDGAHVKCAHKALEEKPTVFVPLSEHVDSFVILENVLVLHHVGGLYGGEVASDVAAGKSRMNSR